MAGLDSRQGVGFEDAAQRSLFRQMLWVTGVTLSGFSVLQFLSGHALFASLELIASVLLVWAAWRVGRARHLTLWMFLYLLPTCSFLLYIIVMPDASPTAFVWVYSIPPLIYLLLGKRLGFILTMRTFDRTRPGIGAQAVGVAHGALDAAIQYAREREQFEKKIISFQAIQHMLADMAIQVEAARALVYAVARYIDSNPRDFSKVSAMSQVFPSDVAMKVVVDAIQVFGGYGYMKEYPVEKMMRDAKILQIYEGTNQIQRNIIGLELVKQSASKKRS